MISYRYVEKPLREIAWSASRAKTLSRGLAATLASTVILYGAGKAFGDHLYTGTSTLDTLEAQANRGIIGGTSINPQNCSWYLGEGPTLAKSISLCTLRSKSTQPLPRIFVLGDSHAGHLVGLLKHLYVEDKLSIRLLYVHGQSAPIFPGSVINKGGQKDKDMQTLILDKTLADLRPRDIVILSSYMNRKVEAGKDISQDANFEKWLRNLDGFTKTAKQKHAKVVFFAPTPDFGKYGQEITPPEACLPEWFRPNPPENCRLNADRKELRTQIENFMLGIKSIERQNNNFYIYDPFPILCPEGLNCSNYLNGVRTFFDVDHLNIIGGEYLYKDFMKFLVVRQLISKQIKI